MAILAAKTQNFFWLARRARGALRRYMGLRREGARGFTVVTPYFLGYRL